MKPPDPRPHREDRDDSADDDAAAEVSPAGCPHPNPPALQRILHLDITVGRGVDIGQTPAGFRRVVPIIGGRVGGPLMTGLVLPGGADIQHVRSDTETRVLAQYILKSDRDEIVLVTNTGIRTGTTEDIARLQRDQPVDPARIYFATTPTFETAAPRLTRLNTHIYLGSGTRMPGRVLFDIFEVQ